MTRITTHVLDITRGKPARGVTIIFYGGENDEWTELARGISDDDGRISDLLNKEDLLKFGIYKMRFETKDYFDRIHTKTFYPYVEIIVEILANQHYHIPLLLSPYAYSTYRGS